MKSYITQVYSVHKDSFDERGCSLSSKDYRQLKVSVNSKPLQSLIQKSYQGKEIGSSSYMKHSKYRFLKTGNLSTDFGINEKSIEYCRPESMIHPQYGDILIAKDGGGEGLGESVLYNLQNIHKTDAISAGIFGLRVSEKNRYYLLGILKSNHFKNFIDINTPQGSIIRHSKKVALHYPVPFSGDVNVQELVAFIVQNILDKEAQIKLKNKKIDELIKKELEGTQRAESFSYSYPRISELKEEARFDTGIYEREYKSDLFVIENYTNGNFYLNDFDYNFISGSTPNIYLPSKDKKDYWWIAVADIQYGLLYKKIVGIRLKNNIKNILKDGDILITRKGATVGKMNLFFKEQYIKAFVNEDIKVLRFDLKLFKKVFFGMFLKSKYGQIQMLNHGSKGTKQGLTNGNITDVLVPNFPESKQKEIAKEYYNPTEKNLNLNFENYLEKEKVRNDEAGIFQLNMELFSLREKLEDLIDKIVKEEKIDISFEY